MADIDAPKLQAGPRLRLSPNDPSSAEPMKQLQPNDLWPLTKQIDGLGGEWTFPIFVWRTLNFHATRAPILYYEPISDFGRLSLEALLMQRAAHMAPPSEQGALHVVLKVFPSIFDSQDGVLMPPAEGEPCIGQHTFSILGLHDEDTLVFRNTWPGWKDDRIGYLSREYFDHYGQEGWIARAWNCGPLAHTAEALFTSSDSMEFRRLWRSGRRQGVITNFSGEKRLRLKWFECWSLQDELPAEVLVLELDGHIRIAVAVLIHYQTVSDLSDLFVWPNYRHKGYGSLIEKAAADQSREAGSEELGLYVWNADVAHGSDQVENFLVDRGYTLERFENYQGVIYGKRRIR